MYGIMMVGLYLQAHARLGLYSKLSRDVVLSSVYAAGGSCDVLYIGNELSIDCFEYSSGGLCGWCTRDTASVGSRSGWRQDVKRDCDDWLRAARAQTGAAAAFQVRLFFGTRQFGDAPCISGVAWRDGCVVVASWPRWPRLVPGQAVLP